DTKSPAQPNRQGSRNSGQQTSDDEDQRHQDQDALKTHTQMFGGNAGRRRRGNCYRQQCGGTNDSGCRPAPGYPASCRTTCNERHARLDGLEGSFPETHVSNVGSLPLARARPRYKILSNALRSVSCLNTNPVLSALFGSTRWPPSKSSLAKSPPTRRSSASGMRKIAGRCSRRTSSSVNFRLVTGIGAVAFTGPEISGRAMTWAIRRIRSSRSIHDIHCLPEPNGPPRPNSKGVSIRVMKPPSVPSTRPIRKQATRTPYSSAGRAALSQASQSSWLKQAWDFADSVSTWSCQRPYQPIAETATTTAGLRSSRAISLMTSPVMLMRESRMLRRLASVHSPLPIGSPARLTIASIWLSAGS